MRIRIYGDPETEAYIKAKELVLSLGHVVTEDAECDVAIAPLLTFKLDAATLEKADLGVLIFHPSPLPYGRGASAIRWAYRRKEPVSAATWFWATSGLDAGDICEQEIVKIDYGLRPREFYQSDIIPAMLRTLKRCLNNLQNGIIRRIPQVEKYSTYDAKIQASTK